MSLLWMAAAHAVSGGAQVAPGAHPAVAAVYVGTQQTCTGFLVAPDQVVTAGHCADPAPTKVVLDRVHAGAHDGELHRVASAHRHPTLDVGVLVLEQPSGVPPARLLPGCAPQTQGTLVGWGAIDATGTQRSDRLRSGVVAAGACQDCDDDALIAAPGPVDSCDGDSGAPVFADTALGHDVVWAMAARSADGASGCGQGGRYVTAHALDRALVDLMGPGHRVAACTPGRPPAPNPPLELALDPQGFGELALQADDPDGDPLRWRLLTDTDHAMVVGTQLVVHGEDAPALALELSDGTWRVPVTVTLARPSPTPARCQSAPAGALWMGVLALLWRRR